MDNILKGAGDMAVWKPDRNPYCHGGGYIPLEWPFNKEVYYLVH